ncbi:MAG TPA: sigma-70 family RNA polymerase sigma factor [Candidatus Limnocylindrales bacterium]|nr:sigma-70 family RNA polymerase sigma factor [Candidatus Limnocylindrales bacterium]
MERELVERARRGDREAYELLARSSARRLYLVAHRILRDADAADDAAQQTLVAIWRELPKLRDPDRFEAWTYRLVVRFSLAEARRRRRFAVTVRDSSPSEPTSADSSASVAVRDELERAFRRLSPEHRAVVVLHHYVGLPLGEIAEALGVPYGTVGSRLHYALRELRAAFGVEDGDPEKAVGGQPA